MRDAIEGGRGYPTVGFFCLMKVGCMRNEKHRIIYVFKIGRLDNIWRGGPNIRTPPHIKLYVNLRYTAVYGKVGRSGRPQVSLAVKIVVSEKS